MTGKKGKKGLLFVKTLNDEEKEKCGTTAGLLEVFSAKYNPKHNKTILLLHYCKLIREQSENAQELIGFPKIKANECTDSYWL